MERRTHDDSPSGYMTLVEFILLHGLEMPGPATLEAIEQRAMEVSQEQGIPVYTSPILDPNPDLGGEE